MARHKNRSVAKRPNDAAPSDIGCHTKSPKFNCTNCGVAACANQQPPCPTLSTSPGHLHSLFSRLYSLRLSSPVSSSALAHIFDVILFVREVNGNAYVSAFPCIRCVSSCSHGLPVDPGASNRTSLPDAAISAGSNGARGNRVPLQSGSILRMSLPKEHRRHHANDDLFPCPSHHSAAACRVYGVRGESLEPALSILVPHLGSGIKT